MPACKHLNYTQEWRLPLCLQDRESFERTGNSYAKRLKKMMGTTLMMLIMRKFPKMLMGSWSHIYWPLSLHLLIYAPLYATKSSILLKKKRKVSIMEKALAASINRSVSGTTAVNILWEKLWVHWLRLSNVIDICDIQPPLLAGTFLRWWL